MFPGETGLLQTGDAAEGDGEPLQPLVRRLETAPDADLVEESKGKDYGARDIRTMAWMLLACVATAAATAGTVHSGFLRPLLPTSACTFSGELLGAYGDLGKYTFNVSTASQRAQALFDQGMVLRYAFTQVRRLRATLPTGRNHMAQF
jgi:hypothetical protein